MGNYKFTFEDGSEALAHYGKKGMHWGEWNEETRQRYLNDGKLPDFQVPAGGSASEDVPGGVYRNDGTGNFYLDKEATENQWHSKRAREQAEKTGQTYDWNTGGVYNKSASGEIARALDNLKANVDEFIKDPGYKLSSTASKTIQEGKKLVDGLLKTAGEEAKFLVEGDKPQARIGSKEAVAMEKSGKPYTKVHGENYHYRNTDSSGNKYDSFNVKMEATNRINREIDDRVRKQNREQTSRYKKSTAKKIRNLVGLD